MNEKLYSLLAELGEQLKESDEVKEYAAAREEYSADRGISEKVAEYNVQRMVYDQESSKDEKDTLLIEQIKARMDALYDDEALYSRRGRSEQAVRRDQPRASGLCSSRKRAGLRRRLRELRGLPLKQLPKRLYTPFPCGRRDYVPGGNLLWLCHR